MAKCNGTMRQLQTPFEDAARLHRQEVSKVQHYWLDINALNKPMQISETVAEYQARQR